MLYGLDPALYDSYDVSTQLNSADTVRMNGVGFSYKQGLTFLPRWARGVQVFANASVQRAIGAGANNGKPLPLQPYRIQPCGSRSAIK